MPPSHATGQTPQTAPYTSIPPHFHTSTLLAALITLIAYHRGSLSPSGVLGALVVGSLTLTFGGWSWALLLAVFFVTSSLLSHFKESEKRVAAEKFDKTHRRDLGQVLANGGAGALVALFSVLAPSPLWFPLFLGIMATVNADTWATELGTLSAGPPRLITTGRRVDAGASGGVSPLGTAVSLAGGLLIGFTALIGRRERSSWPVVLIAGIAGLAGSLFDSLLGATVQLIYYCDNCCKETERKVHKCGRLTRPLRGLSWLNNDLVNLLASLVGGLVALALWLLLNKRRMH